MVLNSKHTTIKLEAVSLNLDDVAEESFQKVVSGLPTLIVNELSFWYELSKLSEDLVMNPEPEQTELSLEELVDNLENIVDQIQTDEVKKRFVSIIEKSKTRSKYKSKQSEGIAVPQSKNSDELIKRVSKKQIKIVKQDEDEHTVFGIVLEPETEDAQLDIYNDEEIRKTAWKFLESYQNFGLMHEGDTPLILPLESYLAPVDFEISDELIKKGTWLLRVRINDEEIWDDIKKGNLTGFSIGGFAKKTLIEDDNGSLE